MKYLIDKLWKTPVMFLCELAGFIVVPIALLKTKKEDDHLPHWAYPWCNEWDGINGLSLRGHWEEKWGKEGVRKFWPRFLWLAVRNRASNMSQILGKEYPHPDETWKKNIHLWPTKKYLKFTWGYTTYYPGSPGPPEGNSLMVMPKKNFLLSISFRSF